MTQKEVPPHGNGLDAGYGKARLGAHGALGIVAIISLATIAGVLYVGQSVFANMRLEHERITQAIVEQTNAVKEQARATDRMSCVLTLRQEERIGARGYSKDEFANRCYWLRTER